MYYLTKTIEISGAHRLSLDYASKCTELHGHNWTITVHCRAEELDHNGMIIDFAEIKRRIADPLDHKVLNDVLPFNPTAENLARWCCEQIESCYRVDVQESAGNVASYQREI
ncbi:MAG: 6-carboxytetrahydropterin synthase QueD [Bacteroidales bacterium]|nr:6-carboxytetrahydropterin synthase QueD [Bacteroidales bacterium]